MRPTCGPASRIKPAACSPVEKAAGEMDSNLDRDRRDRASAGLNPTAARRFRIALRKPRLLCWGLRRRRRSRHRALGGNRLHPWGRRLSRGRSAAREVLVLWLLPEVQPTTRTSVNTRLERSDQHLRPSLTLTDELLEKHVTPQRSPSSSLSQSAHTLLGRKSQRQYGRRSCHIPPRRRIIDQET